MTKRKFRELEFMLSEFELLKKYPAGTEIISNGKRLVSTGETNAAMAATCMASYPRMRFEVFDLAKGEQAISYHIAAYMLDLQLKQFRKTYIYEINIKNIRFTDNVRDAKVYSNKASAITDAQLMATFRSSYCKTLNVVIEEVSQT